MLKNTLKSKCILEIVPEGITGSTLRVSESIIYRKKLLTNNKSLLNNKFYNPSHMFVFDNIDDKILEFMKKEVKSSEFADLNSISPLRLLEFLESKLYYN